MTSNQWRGINQKHVFSFYVALEGPFLLHSLRSFSVMLFLVNKVKILLFFHSSASVLQHILAKVYLKTSNIKVHSFSDDGWIIQNVKKWQCRSKRSVLHFWAGLLSHFLKYLGIKGGGCLVGLVLVCLFVLLDCIFIFQNWYLFAKWNVYVHLGELYICNIF